MFSLTFDITAYTFDETTFFSEISTLLYCRRHSKPILTFHEPQPVHVMQNTTTMSEKCREADNLKFRIYLRTISHNLKTFSIQCCPFIGTQPFIVHIGEDTAESIPDEST